MEDPRWAAVLKSALDADVAEEAAAAAAGKPWPPRGVCSPRMPYENSLIPLHRSGLLKSDLLCRYRLLLKIEQ